MDGFERWKSKIELAKFVFYDSFKACQTDSLNLFSGLKYRG